MANSSQTRIWGRLMVSSCMLVGGCRVLILDAQTLLPFGQAKVWAEDDWDAARSFCLLRLCFILAASCLSASNYTTGISHWWAPVVSVWGLLLSWLMVDFRLQGLLYDSQISQAILRAGNENKLKRTIYVYGGGEGIITAILKKYSRWCVTFFCSKVVSKDNVSIVYVVVLPVISLSPIRAIKRQISMCTLFCLWQ